jgi:hypothetical protein
MLKCLCGLCAQWARSLLCVSGPPKLTARFNSHAVRYVLQERSVPAEVLELPQKGDRIIHFAWEPHVRTPDTLRRLLCSAFVQWTHASALLLHWTSALGGAADWLLLPALCHRHAET